MMIKKIFLIFAIAATLVSCSTTPPKESRVDFEIKISEPKRIRFEGKGSAAGFMLSGSMGPMGIAIGVAIDEGIAKDIQSAANTAGFDIKDTVLRSYQNSDSACDIKGIDLNRYGFKMKRGSDDIAVASIDSRVYFISGEHLDISYPAEMTKNQDQFYESALSELKSNGVVVSNMFLAAFKDIFRRACA